VEIGETAMSKTYHIITFGCQMNKNDSEHIAGMFEFNGYKHAEKTEDANIVIFNTCSVRDKAERRVYGQLAALEHLRKQKNLDLEIYLAGCMPAYDQKNILSKAPYIKGFIDLEEARGYPAKRASAQQAWISIMYGCNNFCSYCIVPFTRGKERFRPSEKILKEISQVDSSRYPELMLLGQNVNSYKDKGRTFAQLLEKICLDFPVFKKISFLTSHPKDISPSLIESIAKYSQIDRELHFPLQAGSDHILKLMNRKYTFRHYQEIVARLRNSIPDIKISTDLIVGFPGETEADFQETVRAVKELGFYRINTAAYSARKGTKAESFSEQVTETVKKKRLNLLNQTVKTFAECNL